MKKIHLFTEDSEVQFSHIRKLFSSELLKHNIFVNQYGNESSDGYIVVFGGTSQNIHTRIPKEDRLIILGECTSIRSYDKSYLSQFGTVIGAHKTVHQNHRQAPGHGWFFENSFAELESIEKIDKTNELSLISSNKAFTRGHRLRLDFCRQLAVDFGCQSHFFGRGINEFTSKWTPLKNYKYTIAIENSREDHWITEKLTDPFLAYTYPFYYGAQNAGDYYPVKSFTAIDINDYAASKSAIENVLNSEKHYVAHQQYLAEARHIYLFQHVFTNHINRFVNRDVTKSNKSTTDIIRPDPGDKIISQILQVAQRMFNI